MQMKHYRNIPQAQLGIRSHLVFKLELFTVDTTIYNKSLYLRSLYMKLTKSKLKQLIKEELAKLSEPADTLEEEEELKEYGGGHGVYAPSRVKPKFGSSSTYDCTSWCRDYSEDADRCYADCQDSLKTAARSDSGLGTSDRYMDMRFEEGNKLTKSLLKKLIAEELKNLRR
jgi:hypothetical protein